MNIILVLIDSLNRHHLSAYGSELNITPNLQAFAEKAWRFDNHFVGSLPCMPARREIFTGFQEVMWRPWGPLEPFDARLPRLLAQKGYSTAIVTDHYHYWEESANGYLQSFQSTEMIRGHEIDYWKPLLPKDVSLPQWVQNIETWRPGMGRRYYSNVKDFKREEDFFPAKVMSSAANWLQENTGIDPFFLQVESFDVHEPFHVPEPYKSMYSDEHGDEKFTLWPPYQDVEQLKRFMTATSPEELNYIRTRYLGKLAMVDTWFGKLLKTFDQLDLWSNSMIIVTSDHGHDLGERGSFGKQYPHFDSHANIPLLVWHPEYPGNGRAISALTTTVDIFATVLEAAGAVIPTSTHSQSVLPYARSEETKGREAIYYSTFGQGVCCTDGEWSIFKSPEHAGPLYYYSSMNFPSQTANSNPSGIEYGHFLPGIDLPQWRVPVQLQALSAENFLFHRSEDPEQNINLWIDDQVQRKRMLDVLQQLLAQQSVPSEQYVRLGLTAK